MLIVCTFTLIESTFIISYPSKVIFATVGATLSTAAPSVCQLAASSGVPTGIEILDGTLKERQTLIIPPIVRALLITSLNVCVGSTAAALVEVA